MPDFRFPIPSTKQVRIGVLILIVNQGVLVVLNSSLLVHAWSLISLSACLVYAASCMRSHNAPDSTEAQAQAASGSMKLYELEQLRANQEKLTLTGTLAAGIAHEIRNPLTSLRGFLQLLGHERHRYAEIMLQEVDRMNEIVNELLELAKPRSSHLQARPLLPILHNVIVLLKAEANLCNVQIELQADLEVEPEPHILCDDNRLKQVFINLIKNAIEAMASGGQLTIQVVLDETQGLAIVRLSDEGCGIPAELLESIGRPFVTSKEWGTGLGLMVCTRIIQDHKGDIRFNSRPDGGTVVTVALPILR